MHQWAKSMFALAAPLLLTGCLWGPGKFTSDLTLKKDGSFVLDYRGRDRAADCRRMPMSSLSRGARTWRIATMASESIRPSATDRRQAQCGHARKAEIEQKRNDYEKQETRQALASARKAEQMAKMFGFPASTTQSNRAFAAKLMKYAGWRSVPYRGNGVFDVDYHFDGSAKQDFVFPALPDNDLLIPFIAIRRRADGSVLVTAPALTGGAGPLARARLRRHAGGHEGRAGLACAGALYRHHRRRDPDQQQRGWPCRARDRPAGALGRGRRRRRRFPRRSSACSELSAARRSGSCLTAVLPPTVARLKPGDYKCAVSILAALLAACASSALAAPTPKDQLLVPPSDAAHYRRRLDGGEAWR